MRAEKISMGLNAHFLPGRKNEKQEIPSASPVDTITMDEGFLVVVVVCTVGHLIGVELHFCEFILSRNRVEFIVVVVESWSNTI